MDSWKDFFDRTIDGFFGRTMVHDYQLTTIGAALEERFSSPMPSPNMKTKALRF